MTKTMLDILGTIFLVLGVAGIVSPDMAGMHLGVLHNLIHIAVGALALMFGLRASLGSARKFSWAAGIFYGLFGLVGLGFSQIKAAEGAVDGKLLQLVPHLLEFGRNDHVLHLMAGVLFVISAALARPVEPSPESQQAT